MKKYIPSQAEVNISLMIKAENLGHDLRISGHPRLADILDIIDGSLQVKTDQRIHHEHSKIE